MRGPVKIYTFAVVTMSVSYKSLAFRNLNLIKKQNINKRMIIYQVKTPKMCQATCIHNHFTPDPKLNPYCATSNEHPSSWR